MKYFSDLLYNLELITVAQSGILTRIYYSFDSFYRKYFKILCFFLKKLIRIDRTDISDHFPNYFSNKKININLYSQVAN